MLEVFSRCFQFGTAFVYRAIVIALNIEGVSLSRYFQDTPGDTPL